MDGLSTFIPTLKKYNLVQSHGLVIALKTTQSRCVSFMSTWKVPIP